MAKILLLEDNLDILYANRVCLELEGYEVFVGKNTIEGKEILFRERPELLVLDITIPDSEKIDFCKALSAEIDFETIFLIPIGSEDKLMENIKRNGFFYVLKPYLMETFINLIKSVLGEK